MGAGARCSANHNRLRVKDHGARSFGSRETDLGLRCSESLFRAMCRGTNCYELGTRHGNCCATETDSGRSRSRTGQDLSTFRGRCPLLRQPELHHPLLPHPNLIPTRNNKWTKLGKGNRSAPRPRSLLRSLARAHQALSSLRLFTSKPLSLTLLRGYLGAPVELVGAR
jgi:hypothetical protein